MRITIEMPLAEMQAMSEDLWQLWEEICDARDIRRLRCRKCDNDLRSDGSCPWCAGERCLVHAVRECAACAPRNTDVSSTCPKTGQNVRKPDSASDGPKHTV
jgi:hypothetical protein